MNRVLHLTHLEAFSCTVESCYSSCGHWSRQVPKYSGGEQIVRTVWYWSGKWVTFPFVLYMLRWFMNVLFFPGSSPPKQTWNIARVALIKYWNSSVLSFCRKNNTLRCIYTVGRTKRQAIEYTQQQTTRSSVDGSIPSLGRQSHPT